MNKNSLKDKLSISIKLIRYLLINSRTESKKRQTRSKNYWLNINCSFLVFEFYGHFSCSYFQLLIWKLMFLEKVNLLLNPFITETRDMSALITY